MIKTNETTFNTSNPYQDIRSDILSIRPVEPEGLPLTASDLLALDGVIKEEQRAYVEHLVEHGLEGTVDARITAELVYRLIKSQGKNRTPNWPHIGSLAAQFQPGFGKGFEPSMSQVCIDVHGWSANGGHTSRSSAQAFFPTQYWIDFELFSTTRPKTYKDAEGNEQLCQDETGATIYETVHTLPPLYGTDDDDGPAEIAFDGDPDSEDWASKTMAEKFAHYDSYLSVIPEHKRFLRIAINAPDQILIRFDSIQRGRYGEEALELFGPSRQRLPLVDLFLQKGKLYSAVFRQFRLCANTTPTQQKLEGTDKTWTKYGTIAGGGNTQPREYTAVYLVLDPILHEHFAASGLTNKSTQKDKSGPEWGAKQVADAGLELDADYDVLSLHRKDILTALLRLDLEGATHLGKALRGELRANSKAVTTLTQLCQRVSKAKKDPQQRSLATPGIVQAFLIAAGNNEVPVSPQEHPTRTPYEHQTQCRGRTWDRGDVNEYGESFKDVMYWARTAVEKWYNPDKPKSKGGRKRRTKK